jgi:DNA-binding transcriptional ArsR family regulator
MDDITVDRKTLKALATDTRITILKKLGTRRMTQAELAQSIGISAPSVSEHVRSLQEADLITTIDDGRKWKYFELTQKGSAIIKPSNARVWFMLAISLLALSVASFGLFNKLSMPIEFGNQFAAAGIGQEGSVLAARQSNEALGAMNLPADDKSLAAAQGNGAAIPAGDGAGNAAIGNAQAPPAPPGEIAAEQQSAASTTGAQPQFASLSLLNAMPIAETVAVLASVLAVGFALGLMSRERE